MTSNHLKANVWKHFGFNTRVGQIVEHDPAQRKEEMWRPHITLKSKITVFMEAKLSMPSVNQ